MLRYLRRLADRDFALDRGMIPLGSCTMKLNATTEMVAVTWPEFANVHPFAPHEQTRGIRGLVDELSGWLCEITGYDAVSLQPNAGSQGELAGLLAIAAYHRSRGDDQRTVCLIPASAHGTNAASAVMAGLQGRRGQDRPDHRQRRHGRPQGQGRGAPRRPSRRSWSPTPRPTASSRTPSPTCARWCTTPAARSTSTAPTSTPSSGSPGPGKFGADVSHLNLHKTFCIPHGGGGPGRRPGRRARAPRAVPAQPPARPGRRARDRGRPGLGRALRLGEHPADLLGVRAADGRGRPAPRHRGRRAQRQLRRGPAARALPGALLRPRRPGRARVHPRPARHHQGHRRHRRRRRQAAHRLRLPRPDDVVPGGRHADGRAHRERGQGRARPVLRRDDRHPRARSTRSAPARSRPPTACCAVRRTRPRRWPASGTTPTTARARPSPTGVDPTAKYWPPVRRIDGAYGDRHLVCSCPPPEAFED